MYCRNCGERIRSDKCSLCGASLKVNVPQNRMSNTKPLDTGKTSNVDTTKPIKNKTNTEENPISNAFFKLFTFLFYAGGILGGVFIVCLLFWLFFLT